MIDHLPEGYTARPATTEDAAAVSDLWNARSHWIRDTEPHTDQSVLKQWDDPRFNLKTDSLLVFDPTSALVGYAHIRDVKTPPVDVFSGYSIHPELNEATWLWDALFRWIDAEARRVIPKAPEDTQITLLAGASDDNPSEGQRLEELGFEHSRTFHQMKTLFDDPIIDAPLPEGVTIRTFGDENDIRMFTHAYRDAFRDHYGHLEQPFETDLAQWKRMQSDDDFDPSLWFLATKASSGDVTGYCICFPNERDPEMGLVDELGVCRAWRRQGIARGLLTHALKVLQERGFKGADIGVDATNKNQAMTLYESAGMQITRSSHTYAKILRPGINLVTQ